MSAVSIVLCVNITSMAAIDIEKNYGHAQAGPMLNCFRHPCTSAVWTHFKVHTSKEKSYADKAWCDYCHKPFAREHSTLFRHIERNHKDQLKKEDSVVCSKNSNSQEIAAGVVFYISNPASHKKRAARIKP